MNMLLGLLILVVHADKLPIYALGDLNVRPRVELLSGVLATPLPDNEGLRKGMDSALNSILLSKYAPVHDLPTYNLVLVVAQTLSRDGQNAVFEGELQVREGQAVVSKRLPTIISLSNGRGQLHVREVYDLGDLETLSLVRLRGERIAQELGVPASCGTPLLEVPATGGSWFGRVFARLRP